MNNASTTDRLAKPSTPPRAKRKTSAKAAWLGQTDSAGLADMWEFNSDEALEDSDEFRVLDECSDSALRMMLGLPIH